MRLVRGAYKTILQQIVDLSIGVLGIIGKVLRRDFSSEVFLGLLADRCKKARYQV